MVRSELLKKLCDLYPNIIRRDMEKIFSVIFSAISKALYNSEFGACELRKFGRFSVKIQKARTSRNPKTGEQIQIDAKKKIRFRASSVLLKRLNEN